MAGRFKLDQINCQCGIKEDDRPDGELRGCYHCGGSGVVLVQHECGTCDRLYWVRPIALTVYKGKRETSFDGLKLVYEDPTKPPICEDCVLADKQSENPEVWPKET